MSHHSEDEEDDYMSTKFLETAQEFESKRQESYSEKRKRQLREQQAKAYIKPRAQLEAEEREKGLQKSIEQSNKGMKMLMKMGFKQGQGLGNNKGGSPSGIAEPIQVDLKLGRSGIGMDSEMRKREREQEEEELRKRVHIDPEEFRNQMASKAKDAQLLRYINAAASICEKLDEENQVESNILWTLKPPPPPPTVASTEPEDIEKLQEQELEKEGEGNDEAKEALALIYPQEEVDALKSLPLDDQLIKLVNYLRETYFYCFWCRAKYTDQSDLDENCPGSCEDDH
ncbi:G patch domain-containing protein 11-like [Mucor ambiguus]|uniref:G patch domain-containing protein 11-like n=1 Tax=Mucor ambiguus TaxID=91626 RepID=A0A0C9N3X2_9FUNG|nr:G patch domain-containing protein 11-like [Mucor ambiguus]